MFYCGLKAIRRIWLGHISPGQICYTCTGQTEITFREFWVRSAKWGKIRGGGLGRLWRSQFFMRYRPTRSYFVNFRTTDFHLIWPKFLVDGSFSPKTSKLKVVKQAPYSDQSTVTETRWSGLAVTFVTLVTLILFWLIDWLMPFTWIHVVVRAARQIWTSDGPKRVIQRKDEPFGIWMMFL